MAALLSTVYLHLMQWLTFLTNLAIKENSFSFGMYRWEVVSRLKTDLEFGTAYSNNLSTGFLI